MTFHSVFKFFFLYIYIYISQSSITFSIVLRKRAPFFFAYSGIHPTHKLLQINKCSYIYRYWSDRGRSDFEAGGYIPEAYKMH